MTSHASAVLQGIMAECGGPVLCGPVSGRCIMTKCTKHFNFTGGLVLRSIPPTAAYEFADTPQLQRLKYPPS